MYYRRTSAQTSPSFCAVVICCNFTADAGIALRDMSANASTSWTSSLSSVDGRPTGAHESSSAETCRRP